MLVMSRNVTVLTNNIIVPNTSGTLATNNGFSDAVKAQAQSQDHGSFGQHQSDFAQDGGLGQYNCNTCTPLKGG